MRQAALECSLVCPTVPLTSCTADDLLVCQHDLRCLCLGHQWVLSWDWSHKVCRNGVWVSKGCPSLLSLPQWPRVALGLRISQSGRHPDPIIMDSSRPPSCVPWQRLVRSVRCLVQVNVSAAVRVYSLHVLRACLASWGVEFLVSSPPALQVIDTTLRRWGRFFLGWLATSPIASVFLEMGSPDAAHISTSRLVSLFWTRCSRVIGTLSLRLSSTPCFRCLSLGLRVVFPFANLCAFPSLAIVVQGLGPLLTVCGCGSDLALAPFTSASMDVCSRLHPPYRSIMWIPALPPSIVAPIKWCADFLIRRTLWGWPAMILFLGGRAARHLALPSSCPFCEAPQSDMFHCLSECRFLRSP